MIPYELLTEKMNKSTIENMVLYYEYNQHVNRLFILSAAVGILTTTHFFTYLTAT